MSVVSFLCHLSSTSPSHDMLTTVLCLNSTAADRAEMAGKIEDSSHNCVIEVGPTPEFEGIASEPSVLFTVRHAFVLFHRLGVSPSEIMFDTKSGTYLRAGGSIFNKVMCLILLATALVHTPAIMSVSPSSSQSEHLSNSKLLKAETVMNVLLGCTCIAVVTSFYWTAFSKFDAFVEILNHIVRVTQKVQHGTAPSVSPSNRKAQMMSSGIICLYVFMALNGTFGFLLANGNVNKNILEIINYTADMEARAVLMLIGRGNMTDLNENSFSAFAPTAVTVMVAAASCVGMCWAHLCWSSGFCMITAVSVSLWLLLASLHMKIKQKNGKTIEGVKIFSDLVKIIEQVNEIYGWVILFSVLAGVLHFSVDMFTIFKVESDTLERILFLSDFVWFGCTLWASAQVYEEAMKIGTSLRVQFEEEQRQLSSEIKGSSYGCRIEGADVLLLLHQELNAQNVGLKGHGFFTCSHGFIGTVLGLISTYSVIVIQSQT